MSVTQDHSTHETNHPGGRRWLRGALATGLVAASAAGSLALLLPAADAAEPPSAPASSVDGSGDTGQQRGVWVRKCLPSGKESLCVSAKRYAGGNFGYVTVTFTNRGAEPASGDMVLVRVGGAKLSSTTFADVQTGHQATLDYGAYSDSDSSACLGAVAQLAATGETLTTLPLC